MEYRVVQHFAQGISPNPFPQWTQFLQFLSSDIFISSYKPRVGLEPTTYCLQGSCATDCANEAGLHILLKFLHESKYGNSLMRVL